MLFLIMKIILIGLLNLLFSDGDVINQPRIAYNDINIRFYIIPFPFTPITQPFERLHLPTSRKHFRRHSNYNRPHYYRNLEASHSVPHTEFPFESDEKTEDINNILPEESHQDLPESDSSENLHDTYTTSPDSTEKRHHRRNNVHAPKKNSHFPSTRRSSSKVKFYTRDNVSSVPSRKDRFQSNHPNWKLVNDESCGQSNENRIVGGKNASLGQFPWIARIGYRVTDEKNVLYKCGGVLITQQHVLTAAHCIVYLPEDYELAEVELGEYDTMKEIDCIGEECADPVKTFPIKDFVAHENFQDNKFTNDIGIITLSGAVEFTNWITPICLPHGSLLAKNLAGTIVDIAGWGFYDTMAGKESSVLQTVKLPVLNPNVCIKRFKRYEINANRQLCVGGEVGKDSCSGDSGGPLMKVEAVDDGPKFYLFGIVSFGDTYCGLNANPAVYTRVVHYIKWILDRLSINK